MNIQVYGRDNCPYCENTKQLLDTYDIPFTYIDVGVGRDMTREQIIAKFPSNKTFPIIVLGEEILTDGFTSLKGKIADVFERVHNG